MPSFTATGTSTDLLTDLGGTPVAGDSVYIGKGAADYNDAAKNDRSGTDLARVELLPGYSGDFAEATPLKLVCDRTSTGIVLVKWAGRRSYLRSTGAGIIYRVELDPAAGGTLIYSDVDTELFIQRGGVLQAPSTADINKYYGAGFSLASLLKSGPTMAECIAAGNATVALSRAATLIQALEHSRLRVLESSITPTNAYVSGGTIEYAGGNITNLYLYGGVLDLRSLPAPITITNRYAYQPTTILIKSSGVGEPTWTNKPIDYNPPRVVMA